MSLPELFFVLVIAAGSVVLVLFGIRQGRPRPEGHTHAEQDPIALLFEDGVLYHATNKALRQFSFFPGANVWDDLRHALLPRFPDFPNQLTRGATGEQTLFAQDPDDASIVEFNWRDGMCWVELKETDAQRASLEQTQSASTEHLCCQTMAQPVWEELPNGQVGWRNAAYDALSATLERTTNKPIFDLATRKGDEPLSILMPSGAPAWFEVASHTKDGTTLHHANGVTNLVLAKRDQGTFVQALAKTFAHLSIGLAIFDRNGQLNIFNPALVDLTSLPPAFLATQPTMLSFFDALRENRRMPEPKNYRSWRQVFSDMIAAASDDNYRETWTLEDGRTYSVEGRPHPDGATAFLIEDISSEVTLNRNFRVEVEQYEALLDHMDAAIVVFSASGVLTFCNAPYRDLWGHNPEAAFADVTIADAIALWRGTVLPGATWDKVEATVATFGRRERYETSLVLQNGSRILCEAIPIASDATMIRFCTADRSAAALPKVAVIAD